MPTVVSAGAVNWDINIYVRRFPAPGEEVEVTRIMRVPGGTGANVSVAASRILGMHAAACLGALGDDDLGKRQLEILRGEGVETSGVKVVRGEETGQAYILIDGHGENIIHTYLGANRLFLPEDVGKMEVKRLISEAQVVVVMDPPLGTAEEVVKVANEAGKTVVWDPGLYVEMGLERLSPMLKYVDYFIVSSLELEKLVGTGDPEKARKAFRKTLVVKQGSRGATMVRGNEMFIINAVPLKRLKLEVVNTVGCGDAFIGAFASFKALGFEDVEALKWANCAGGFKATKYETRGSPTRGQLEEFYDGAEKYLEVLVRRLS